MADYDKMSGGVFFPVQDKKAQNHPDYTGSVQMTQDLVDDLVEQLKSNPVAKLDLAGWSKTSHAGNQFISLSPKVPYVKQGGGYDQGKNNGGGYNQNGNRPPVRDQVDDDDLPF